MEDLGHSPRVDSAVLDEDPFWSVVRRRHPDVDVTLLGRGTRPVGRTSPALSPAVAGQVARTVHAACVGVARAADGIADVRSPTWSWRAGPGGHALVAQRALRGLGASAGVDLLRTLAAVLDGAGWLLRPSGRDGVAVLDARGPGVDVRAEAGEGATVLTVASRVVPIGPADRARIREEVRSWQ